MKKSVLVALAFFVLLLASGGEHAKNMLEVNAAVATDLAEDDKDSLPNSTDLSFDIFNSVIQVSHLVFHSDLIFEFNLPEISETKAQSVFDTAITFTNFYKTLFRSIISPNAP